MLKRYRLHHCDCHHKNHPRPHPCDCHKQHLNHHDCDCHKQHDNHHHCDCHKQHDNHHHYDCHKQDDNHHPCDCHKQDDNHHPCDWFKQHGTHIRVRLGGLTDNLPFQLIRKRGCRVKIYLQGEGGNFVKVKGRICSVGTDFVDVRQDDNTDVTVLLSRIAKNRWPEPDCVPGVANVCGQEQIVKQDHNNETN